MVVHHNSSNHAVVVRHNSSNSAAAGPPIRVAVVHNSSAMPRVALVTAKRVALRPR